MLPKIPRIIFNFNDQCLNGCPFCFIPFDGKGSGDFVLWQEIMDRASDFSPDMISFSGCDPFYYEDFYTLLEKTPKKCFWGVDSSLIWLNQEKFSSCCHKLDQLSTSWDDVPQMPVAQRYGPKKMVRFLDNLDCVLQHIPNTVVHTLYSTRNANYLEYIADALLARKISTWSLYQFWPFDFIQTPQDFLCETEDFCGRGQEIKNYIANRLNFEYVPYRGRANGYFFVSSTGLVYTTLSGTTGKYMQLGTIFDEHIYEKWYAHSTPALAEAILGQKIKREIRNHNTETGRGK